MKVIAFTNQKGGVGKTTSTSNVGAALAKRGHKVLLIDLDPQANLTDDLGIKAPANTINQMLFFNQNPTPYVINERLHLIAGSNATASFEAHAKVNFTGMEGMVLKSFFAKCQLDYDFLLIDSPPGLGMVVANIYVFADLLFVPLEIDKNAINGLEMVLETSERFKTLNPKLKVAGVFFTKYETQTNVSKFISDYMAENYAGLMMQSKIRINGAAIKEAAIKRQNLFAYAPQSNGATDYEELTNEILLNCNE